MSTFYPYPPEEHRIDPFDTSVGEPQYVILGGSVMTYAYTADWDKSPAAKAPPYEAIPMGYKILRFAQKVAVAKDGRLVREWKRVVTAPSGDGWLHQICGYVVIDEDGRERRAGDGYSHVATVAVARSMTRYGARAVVLYVHGGQNWH